MRYLYVAISLLLLSAGPWLLHATMTRERKNIIVCIGDSLTEGGPGHYMTMAKPLDPADVQYCDVLKDRLPDWKIYNMGRGGNSTWDMRERFTQDVLSLSPGIVIIMGGTNDIVAPATAAEISDRLIEMCHTARTHNITPILCTIPPTTRGNLATLRAVNDRLRRYANEHDIVLVDTYHALLSPRDTYSPHPSLAREDGVHFNEQGKIALGNVIYAMGVAKALR